MKQLSKQRARRKRCRRCDAAIVWASTQAKGHSLMVTEAKGVPRDTVVNAEVGADGYGDGGDLVFSGETRTTARGQVPVVMYVAKGTGTHVQHVCSDG